MKRLGISAALGAVIVYTAIASAFVLAWLTDFGEEA